MSPQAGPSQLRPESHRYSLEVIRVDGIHRRSRKGQLSVEVAVNNSFKTCVAIEHNGRPTSHAALLFSQLGSSSVLNVAFKQSGADVDERLLGHAEIKGDVSALLQKSLPHEFKHDLASTSQSSDTRKRTVTAGTIHFRLNLTDPWDRAEFCVDMAERGLKDISNLADKVSSTDNTISTVIKAVDQIKDIVDLVAEIHPLVDLSWKAVSVVYKVVSFQFKADAELVDMAGKMKDAFYLSSEARSLDDRTNTLLKSKIKSMLDETAGCSRFVQEYAARSFAGRLLHWTDKHKIDEFKDRFDYLRKELDSVINVNIGKGVDDIGFRQLLDTLVDSTKIDISKMSTRARCLRGTRENYLNEIMSVLLPGETAAPPSVDKRIVWLTGAAGVGKSTIALTIADACGSRGSPAAYVFFERGKDEYIFAIRAVAYRLAKLYPSVRSHIARATGKDGNISGSPFKMQFEKLVLEPIQAATIKQPIVIILDALDECGTLSQRKDLMHLLVNDFTDLPPEVRVLVTSRPESDVMKHLQSKSHIHHIELDHTSERDRQDVDQYIMETLLETVEQGPPKGWRWDDVCRELSNAADGLFIWATTAIKMIVDSNNRRRELRMFLEDIRSVGGGIDNLYATVLQQSGIPWDRDEARSESLRILGVILFSKEALSGEDIEVFLDLEEDTVDTVLKPLRSVLFYEPGKPVRLHHASFADYLTSERSHGEPWHIDEQAQRQIIAERCFVTMEAKLEFNICRLSSSFILNDEIPDLATRVESRIPPDLKYACLHWAQHLADVPYSCGVLKMLSDFALQRLLFWFEVLSLTKTFGRVAADALSGTSSWCEPHDASIASFLQDAKKLASIFVLPIMTSSPHVYVSMIPLSEGDSEVATHYAGRMSSMVRIDRTGVQRPPLCLKVLEGHNDVVECVAFAPNGKHLASASASWGDTVKVWDIDSSKEIFTPLKGRTACFSPGGDRIVTGSWYGSVRVWNARNGDLILGPLKGHTDWVNSVAWSSDGTRIASGSEDKNVILWDRDGKVIFRLEGHKNRVTSVAFSPDNTRLASGSRDRTIRIWSVKSGQLAFGPFEAQSSVNSVAFSPDGAHLVSGSDDGTIRIPEVESGNVISTLEGDGSSVLSVVYTACGTHIVSGCYGMIKVWDAKSGNIVQSFEGHTRFVKSVAISRDGKYIASGSSDKTIRIWDATAITSISKASTKHSEAVVSVAFSPDGTQIASASSDRSIIVWDADTGNIALGPLLGHEYGVTCVAFLPDGSRLLSGSWDKTIRIWDAKTGESVMDPLVHDSRVKCIAVSLDGNTVVSGSGDRIRVWCIATGQLVTWQREGHSGSVYSVAFSPNGKRFASGSDDCTIVIWNTDSWETISHLTGHSEEVDSVCFSPDGTRLASGSRDRSIIIWDSESGQKVSGPFQGHTAAIQSVVYSLGGRHVISGSEDNMIRVWNVENGQTVCKLGGHSNSVNSLALSPNSRRVVSGSYDNIIRVWNVADIPQPSAEDADSAGASLSGWVLKADGWVLSGQGQNDLLIWIPPDLRSTLCRYRNTAVMSCDFSTKLDFRDAAFGTRWTECFVPPENMPWC